jgi:hypothetical protein
MDSAPYPPEGQRPDQRIRRDEAHSGCHPPEAEEVRELKHLRPYSPWCLQGEATAKVNGPSRQILYATRWAPDSSGALVETDVLWNRAFMHPVALWDIREIL